MLADVIVFAFRLRYNSGSKQFNGRRRKRYGPSSPPSRSRHGHGHSHDHGHAHGHAGHSHAPDHFGFAFAFGATLNTLFVIAELVFGYTANSLALISDAVHNFSDVISLLLAWCAMWLASKQPTQRHTYGYRRASILAALVNAGLLLIAVGGIAVEAINRIQEPASVKGWTVVLVAAFGILVNGGTALLFMRGRHGDLNIRGAYLHMAADAAVSFGVVVAALVIMATGWLWVDPVISLCIAAVVLASGWGLAKDSVNLALDGVPKGIELAKVQRLSRPARRRHRAARPAYLGHEHQRDRADRASGVPRRL